MKLTLVNPIRLDIKEATPLEVKLLVSHLSYTNKSIQYQISKVKKYRWMDEEQRAEKVEALKKESKKCLLFEDEDGYWTYSGLVGYLCEKFPNSIFSNEIEYPEPKLIPWANKPKFDLRDYQKEAVQKLLDARHGGIALSTGAGKSYVLLHLVKELGLKTLVVAPTLSIANQLYDDFVYYLGKSKVGRFYQGKKEPKKLIVIGVSASLDNIKVGDNNHDLLSKTQVVCFDEAHQCAAESLVYINTQLVPNASYRSYVSATQLRNDGCDLLLKAITGSIVIEKNYKELAEGGYLTKLLVKAIEVESLSSIRKEDVNENTRIHFYYNNEISKRAGDLANKFIANGRPTLILIKEIEQFQHILPYLKYPPSFAHGGNLSIEQKKKLPKDYHDSDSKELVKKFKNGETKLLIATSCISMGTDIPNVSAMINLRAGASEIDVRQSLGRSSRNSPGKENAIIIDFDVINNDRCHRHFLIRLDIYKEHAWEVSNLKY